jgi:serine protein kinase
LREESKNSVAYEGRFGASPREMKMLLYFAAQSKNYDQLMPLCVFEEIEKLTQDRSVYDYLQFESRGGYHDCKAFLGLIKEKFAKHFHKEFLESLNLFDESQYIKAFENYIKNTVAFVKNEKIFNEMTGKNEEPMEASMSEIEALVGWIGDKRELRERVVARIASWKLENNQSHFSAKKVFSQEIDSMFRNIYESRKESIEHTVACLMTWGSDDFEKLPTQDKENCENVFAQLSKRFGYTRNSAWRSLIFLRSQSK